MNSPSAASNAAASRYRRASGNKYRGRLVDDVYTWQWVEEECGLDRSHPAGDLDSEFQFVSLQRLGSIYRHSHLKMHSRTAEDCRHYNDDQKRRRNQPRLDATKGQ